MPTRSKLSGQVCRVLCAQGRRRKTCFCVGGQGLTVELACRGSTRLHPPGDKGQDMAGTCNMVTRAQLYGCTKSMCLEVHVEDGSGRTARVQVPGRSDWSQQGELTVGDCPPAARPPWGLLSLSGPFSPGGSFWPD